MVIHGFWKEFEWIHDVIICSMFTIVQLNHTSQVTYKTLKTWPRRKHEWKFVNQFWAVKLRYRETWTLDYWMMANAVFWIWCQFVRVKKLGYKNPNLTLIMLTRTRVCVHKWSIPIQDVCTLFQSFFLLFLVFRSFLLIPNIQRSWKVFFWGVPIFFIHS